MNCEDVEEKRWVIKNIIRCEIFWYGKYVDVWLITELFIIKVVTVLKSNIRKSITNFYYWIYLNTPDKVGINY